MDAPVLMNADFWDDASPLAMVAAGLKAPDLAGMPGHVFFQSSGSTAAAKWIALSRASLLNSAAMVNAHLKVGAGSCWGLLLPLHHVGGFGVVARAHQAACRMAEFDGRWNACAAASWLAGQQVTHTSLVPTQVHDLVTAGLRAPETLRAVVVGGGQLPRALGQQARDLGWPVLASYGMTEAASQIATQPLDALDAPYQPAPIPLLPHWQVAVDEAGCLRIAGESLFAGTIESGRYHQRLGHWHLTRDRVALSQRQLTPLGRADLQVKVLGELVDLGLIEQELVDLSGGSVRADCLVVVALPDERTQHRLLPVFDGALDRASVLELLARHARHTPGFSRLADPVFLDPFPRSELGKPRRLECLRRIEQAG